MDSIATTGQPPALPPAGHGVWSRALTVLLWIYWPGMFVVTHVPASGLSPGPAGFDKVIHFSGYWLLTALLVLRHLLSSTRIRMSRVRLLALVAAYAVGDELTQALPVFQRHADWWDGAADLCGAVLGLVMVEVIMVRQIRANTFTDISKSGSAGA